MSETARVPDLPCGKCGHDDVCVRYCDGCRKRLSSDECQHAEPEHLHRSCRRCGYGWVTRDVIDAQVMCWERRDAP